MTRSHETRCLDTPTVSVSRSTRRITSTIRCRPTAPISPMRTCTFRASCATRTLRAQLGARRRRGARGASTRRAVASARRHYCNDKEGHSRSTVCHHGTPDGACAERRALCATQVLITKPLPYAPLIRPTWPLSQKFAHFNLSMPTCILVGELSRRVRQELRRKCAGGDADPWRGRGRHAVDVAHTRAYKMERPLPVRAGQRRWPAPGDGQARGHAADGDKDVDMQRQGRASSPPIP